MSAKIILAFAALTVSSVLAAPMAPGYQSRPVPAYRHNTVAPHVPSSTVAHSSAAVTSSVAHSTVTAGPKVTPTATATRKHKKKCHHKKTKHSVPASETETETETASETETPTQP
ncbi:hypothetical protein HKX48_001700, partial [Thoreauomyces humboldtii]